jgi:hypothetical protein
VLELRASSYVARVGQRIALEGRLAVVGLTNLSAARGGWDQCTGPTIAPMGDGTSTQKWTPQIPPARWRPVTQPRARLWEAPGSPEPLNGLKAMQNWLGDQS